MKSRETLRSCEEYQANASAMMDGELHGEELTETVKHLAKCQTCMEELRKFQVLQDRLNAELTEPDVPADVWPKISIQSAPKQKAMPIPLGKKVAKIISIAAVIAIAFLSGYFVHHPSTTPVFNPDEPIVLASNPGQMDDAHFLALTRELLSADPVYHQKMYFILHTLNSQRWEGSVEAPDMDDMSSSLDVLTADNADDDIVFRF